MNKSAIALTGEGKNVDLTAAIKWLNATVTNNIGHSLREPEIVILKGTWRGLTYEQMSNGSDYSTNYLMRDVAPKLWKQLSHVFGQAVGKTNFRVALESYVAANAATEPELANYGLVDQPSSDRGFSNRYVQEFGSNATDDADLYWHPAIAPDSRKMGMAGSPSRQRIDASSAGMNTQAGHYHNGMSSMSVATLYGYSDELTQAKQWLSDAAAGLEGHSRLVGIWGIGGVGKTLLAETLVSQVGDQFDVLVWRSLQAQPTLQDLSSSILIGLGITPQPTQVTAQLLAVMARRSLLIVLAGVESILDTGKLAGEYRSGYQAYGEFFQLAAGLRSCVVVTGIEGPAGLKRQGGYGNSDGSTQNVRSLTLSGISERAATELLQAESLSAIEHWPALIARYQGHPLALKAASRVIREIFNGRVDEFLKQTSVLFTDVLRLLAPSFDRLSSPEVNVLYWLASQEEPLSLADLQQSLPVSLGSTKLISALDSLKQRSLLEVQTTPEQPPTFYLSPLVKAYAVHRFVDEFGEATSHEEPAGQQDIRSFSAVGEPSTYSQSTHFQDKGKASYPKPIINLSTPRIEPIQLSPWFQGHFDTDWQTLDRLFASSSRPALRLRNAYHLRDETFVKRCKSITLNVASSGEQLNPSATKAFLVVAVHQDTEHQYRVCVQAQPAKEADVLPESLAIKLLDTDKNALATVVARQSDTFIQLPYFRGSLQESFEIELALGTASHTESFVI